MNVVPEGLYVLYSPPSNHGNTIFVHSWTRKAALIPRFILLQKLDKYSRKLTGNIMHVYPRSEVLGVFCYTYGDRFILRVKKSCGVATPQPISSYFQHVNHEPHSSAIVCRSCGMTLRCLLSLQIGLRTLFCVCRWLHGTETFVNPAFIMKCKGHVEYRVHMLLLVVTLQRRVNVYSSISPHFFKIHLLFPSHNAQLLHVSNKTLTCPFVP
jgi:hypothetical protein